MNHALKTICLFTAVLTLCGCARISSWLHKQNMAAEENYESTQVETPAHPIGVTYDIESSIAPRRQISLYFNGEGLARLLEVGMGRDKKTLIDFGKQEITNKDFTTNWQEATKIDPFTFPSVLNAKDALQAKALCLGKGFTRGFPYHRWGMKKNADEWEVWTDDKDNFPIYYRSIKDGSVTTWTLVNSWVDGSTYDRPTFFSLSPDPPPPEPVKTAEQIEQEAAEREMKQHHKHHGQHRRSALKKGNKQVSG